MSDFSYTITEEGDGVNAVYQLRVNDFCRVSLHKKPSKPPYLHWQVYGALQIEEAKVMVEGLNELVSMSENVQAQGKVKKRRIVKEDKPEFKNAAAHFRHLIMEGKLTDDRIFEVVKKAFNLADNKRSYVGFYRKELIKKGKNPPTATKET